MSVEIEITRMGLEGQGVGYDSDGNIYFVPGAVTGDRCAVTPECETRRYRDAHLDAVVVPAPERVTPPCSHFKTCGGCDWLHWEYSAQLRAKENILKHVLVRGGLTPETFHPMIPSPQTLGYRHRIQVRQIGNQVGFYKRGTHEIVDVENCPVAHPKLNEAIRALREEPSQQLRKAELFVGEDGELGSLFDVGHAAGGFTQVNAPGNERLREVVAGALREAGSRHVVELFCGNGNLTLAFAPNVDTVYAVDSSRAAISRARETAAARGLVHLQFVVGGCEAASAKMPPDVAERCDTLVLDPPRTGMPGSLSELARGGVRTIVYVSCSPVAFSKDVQCLKKGYTLRSVQPVDMFPHTRHIEFVSVFSRSVC